MVGRWQVQGLDISIFLIPQKQMNGILLYLKVLR